MTNVSDVQTLARMQEERKYIKTRIECPMGLMYKHSLGCRKKVSILRLG